MHKESIMTLHIDQKGQAERQTDNDKSPKLTRNLSSRCIEEHLRLSKIKLDH